MKLLVLLHLSCLVLSGSALHSILSSRGKLGARLLAHSAKDGVASDRSLHIRKWIKTAIASCGIIGSTIVGPVGMQPALAADTVAVGNR